MKKQPYHNDRLMRNLKYILANSYRNGDRDYRLAFAWHEPAMLGNTTRENRKFWEHRALAVLSQIPSEFTAGKSVNFAWTTHNELVISVHPD
jgi:hypothetical protein